jgi:hypothetical protein
MTWKEFNQKLRKRAIVDEEDDSIFYDGKHAQTAGM